MKEKIGLIEKTEALALVTEAVSSGVEPTSLDGKPWELRRLIELISVASRIREVSGAGHELWITRGEGADATEFKVNLLRTREQAARDARRDESMRIAHVGVDLINAYNTGRTDPSMMAVLGHDTMSGYQFSIQKNGVTYRVEVTRDMADG